MKRLIKFGSIGLVIAGAIAGVGEVFAQDAAAPSMSRLTRTANGVSQQQLLIVGTPRTQVPVTIGGEKASGTRQIKTNACGHIVISNANTYETLTVGGNLIDPAAVLAQAVAPVPVCADGVSSATTAERINLGNNRIFVSVGASSSAPNGRAVDVAYEQTLTKSRFVTLNQCGIGRVSIAGATGQTTVALNNAAPVNFSSLLGNGEIPMANCIGQTTGIFTGVSNASAWKNSAGDFYYMTSPSGNRSFAIAGTSSVNRSVTSDRCGGLTIGSATNPQTTGFTINGSTIDPSALSVGLKPNCVLGTNGSYAYDVAPTANIKTSDGRIFIKGTSTNPTGFGDRTIQNYSSPVANGFRAYTADACGLIKIRATTPALTEITDQQSGNTFDMATLDKRETVCSRAGGTSVIYRSLLIP